MNKLNLQNNPLPFSALKLVVTLNFSTIHIKNKERDVKMLNRLYIAILTLQLILTILSHTVQSSSNHIEIAPIPSPWPEQFHALLYMNLSSSKLQISNLWYDWPKGRNVNIIQKQLDVLLYDIEWNNGTSFYYTLGDHGTCMTMQFEVGILRPDFLDGAKYVGTAVTDGFLCNVWEKVDFIWYYEDVLTNRPVRWDFYDGISTHVITFEVGAKLQDSLSQAPSYCFSHDKELRMLKAKTPVSEGFLNARNVENFSSYFF